MSRAYALVLGLWLCSGCPSVSRITGAVPHCGDPGEAPCAAGTSHHENIDAEGDLQVKVQRVVEQCRASHEPTARAIWVKLHVSSSGRVKDDVGVRGSDEAPVVDKVLAACIREAASDLRAAPSVVSSFTMEYAAVDSRPNDRARAALTTAVQNAMKACAFESSLVAIEFEVETGGRPTIVSISDIPPEPKACLERDLGSFWLGSDPLRTRTRVTIPEATMMQTP